jgi:hypothetical protein
MIGRAIGNREDGARHAGVLRYQCGKLRHAGILILALLDQLQEDLRHRGKMRLLQPFSDIYFGSLHSGLTVLQAGSTTKYRAPLI